jgi:predicted DNA-binding transcriptional regulator AlpA
VKAAIDPRMLVQLTATEFAALVRDVVREELDARRPAAPGEDRELAMPEILQLLGIRQKKTIWTWRRTKGFPAPRKFGGRVRWLLSEVNAWRASREVSGPGAVARRPRLEGREPKTAPTS